MMGRAEGFQGEACGVAAAARAFGDCTAMRIFNRYNMFQNNLTVTIKDVMQGVKSLSSSLKIKIEFLC